jgi:cell division protein FtsZ
MAEFGRITGYFKEVVGKDTNVIWGTGFDDSMGEEISVTIIATGFATYEQMYENKKEKNDNKKTITISLGDDPDDVISNTISDEPSENNPVISSDGTPIELEIEFPQNLEEDEAIPDINKNNFTHVKDITDLNNSDYLDFLEGQPAIERKKNNTNI